MIFIIAIISNIVKLLGLCGRVCSLSAVAMYVMLYDSEVLA